MITNVNSKSYWSWTKDFALKELNSSEQGLTEEQLEPRLKEFGFNEVIESKSFNDLALFAAQFKNPLIWILLFAASISSYLGEWIDASIVFAIIFASTVLGYVQEFRASRAIQKLLSRITHTVTVQRGGHTREIPSRELLPGDIMFLNAGTLIPADGLLLESKDLFVNEALLTGESLPVEKHVAQFVEGSSIQKQSNCVFSGTSVRSGTAKFLVVNTGLKTHFGKLSKDLEVRHKDTDFEKGLRQFGALLSKVMIAFVLVVIVGNLISSKPFVDSLVFSIALAVGLSPELLPAILGVTLSKGALRMSRSGVLVRRLNSIETLGTMDLLCCDKTGTLTQGEMQLHEALDTNFIDSQAVKDLSFLNAYFQTGIPNPLDEAILRHLPHGASWTEKFKKIDEISYDFQRKRLSVCIQENLNPEMTRMITKGAVDKVLSVCTWIREAGDMKILSHEKRLELQSQLAVWGDQGLRVLALATRDWKNKNTFSQSEEFEMCFEGFLLFRDPPHPDAAAALEKLRSLGIQIKIITGDNRYVSVSVGKAVGIQKPRLLTGEAMFKMTDQELSECIEEIQMFVEVDPQQKERIVNILKDRNHVVGFMGDGINDAPALNAADLGISVESAVDVAKETADLVLVKHNLDLISDGIVEGRKTFANTLKYIYTTTSANFGNMLSMAAASFFLPFLPLLAKQILLNNFLSDIPSMAIGGDLVDEDSLHQPQRWEIKNILKFMMSFGFVSSLFDGITFFILLAVFQSSAVTFQTAWFVESLLTELLIVFVVRTHKRLWKSRPSSWLLVTSVVVALLALYFPYSFFATYFGFEALSLPLVFTLIGISIAYVMCSEILKTKLLKWNL